MEKVRWNFRNERICELSVLYQYISFLKMVREVFFMSGIFLLFDIIPMLKIYSLKF